MRSPIIVFSLVVGATLLFSSKIRGIRNNNLLNIKYDPKNDWVGMIGADDKGSVKFIAPVYSLRAGFILLNTYQGLGVKTIWDIIHRFAPPKENPTLPYINFVSQNTGIAPYIAVSYSQWPAIIQQMATFETGKTPPMSLVLQAQKLAFS